MEVLNRYQRFVTAILVLVVVAGTGAGAQERPSEYPIKLLNLETGYVLGHGANIQVGLGQTGFGIRDRVQFTTNMLLDIVTFVNGQVKVGLLNDDGRLPAMSIGFAYYNLASANYIVERALKEGFADKDMEINSGLSAFAFFMSISRRLHERVRVHAGFQYRYLEGSVDSDSPFELTSDQDTALVYLSVDQGTNHRSFMTAVDFDLIPRVKLMFELGYDQTYDRGRGGAGIRLNPAGGFNLQFGVLWPGIDVDEDVEFPVIPNLEIYGRF